MPRLKKWQGLSLRVRRSGLRLPVAEDGEDNRLLLQHSLQGEPVAVQFAPDGQEAVNLVVGGGEFDLILMDLDMPVLDGYAATRQIREWQSSRAVRRTHAYSGIVGARPSRAGAR